MKPLAVRLSVAVLITGVSTVSGQSLNARGDALQLPPASLEDDSVVIRIVDTVIDGTSIDIESQARALIDPSDTSLTFVGARGFVLASLAEFGSAAQDIHSGSTAVGSYALERDAATGLPLANGLSLARDGIVMSSGDVGDYASGSNSSESHFTPYEADPRGTPYVYQNPQNIIGAQPIEVFSNKYYALYSVLELIPEERLPNPTLTPPLRRDELYQNLYDVSLIEIDVVSEESQTVALVFALGSEEFDEYLQPGDSYPDVFGVVVNEDACEDTEPSGFAIALDIKARLDAAGIEADDEFETELDGNFYPVGSSKFTVNVDLNAGPNTLTFVIADTFDSLFDTTVFIEQIGTASDDVPAAGLSVPPTTIELGSSVVLSQTGSPAANPFNATTSAVWVGVYQSPIGEESAPFSVTWRASDVSVDPSGVSLTLAIGDGLWSVPPDFSNLSLGGDLVGRFTTFTDSESTFFDLLAYLAEHDAGAPGADLDADGNIDADDITYYLTHDTGSGESGAGVLFVDATLPYLPTGYSYSFAEIGYVAHSGQSDPSIGFTTVASSLLPLDLSTVPAQSTGIAVENSVTHHYGLLASIAATPGLSASVPFDAELDIISYDANGSVVDAIRVPIRAYAVSAGVIEFSSDIGAPIVPVVGGVVPSSDRVRPLLVSPGGSVLPKLPDVLGSCITNP